MPPPLRISWLIWGIGALFYLMAFFHRVAPAVMTEELMKAFDISATGLGNLSAFYFYSYVAMQIPTGIIADHWGPRRLLSLGALVAGIGTIVFATAPGIVWASAGRLLIGGSVAVAFVGILKLAANWFPARYFSLASGMALFVGIVGAVAAGPPLRLLITLFSWRSVILMSALATIAVCATIWWVVRDFPHDRGYADHPGTATTRGEGGYGSIFQDIMEVSRYPNTWLLFLGPGGIVGAVLAFSGLWGVPFLTTHHGMPPPMAATLASALLVAWALGGPAFGWLSDRLGHRKPLYLIGCGLSLGAWCTAIFWPNLSFPALVAALLLAGFSSGCMIISFAFAKESVPARLSGTVSGVVNMGVMMGPMLLQPLVGWMLDLKWGGQTAGGVRLYSLSAFQWGFSLMIAWVALSLFLLIFTRDTRCRQTE